MAHCCRALFLVERDSLVVQAVKKFRTCLGNNLKIERAVGDKEDENRDILVSAIQHSASLNKYYNYAREHFN